MMKVLVAILNWGLGHASRSCAIVSSHIRKGDEVVLAGDGESLLLIRKHFPELRYIELPHLQLSYSSTNTQIGAMIKGLPHLIRHTIADHRALRHILDCEHFDLVISDNRFGCFSKQTRCAYISHQIWIKLPNHWHWAEPIAHALHLWFIKQYDQLWIPDYEQEEKSLSGELGHRGVPPYAHYIGPLSRLDKTTDILPCKALSSTYDIVAVLSGLEPQRSLFEAHIIDRYCGQSKQVLVIRGKIEEPFVVKQHDNITIVPSLEDIHLAYYLRHAKQIIARSGYSTLMDLAALDILHNADYQVHLIATPGQSEQEYLALRHADKSLYVPSGR